MTLDAARETRPRPRIGRYIVTGRIGRGGMGMVYRGLDEALEREVAVKTLKLEGSLDDESRKRFEVEAKAAARLQHPNIVTVYELGEDRGIPFIAMELLAGSDLEVLMRSGEALTLAEQLDVVIQVCRGLSFAHDRGIVHRDVKPSNIRLLDDGTAKIMDFGIAKLGGTNLTKSGMMVGTVHYMSPEQVRGSTLDGRSDVFSVGVILYELLSGRRPFRGEGITEILYRIVHDPPPPIEGDFGYISERLQGIVEKSLAKDPALRFPTAAALADELTATLTEYQKAEGSGVLPRDAADELSGVRKLIRVGDPHEAERRLEQLLERFPNSADVKRAKRLAQREVDRHRAGSDTEEEFPELGGTVLATPTRLVHDTATKTAGSASGAHSPTSRRAFTIGLGVTSVVLLAVLVGGGALLFLRRGSAETRIAIVSSPPGAMVLVDGRDTGVVTDGALVLPAEPAREIELTFRRPGMRDESRRLRIPASEGATVSVAFSPVAPIVTQARVSVTSEPPGAVVNMDGSPSGKTPTQLVLDPAREHEATITSEGFVPQRVHIGPGPTPAAIAVRLEPSGPPATVLVSSSFPVDVSWRGRMLARGQIAPTVTIPAGRQPLTVSSPGVFLRREVVVDVAAGGRAQVVMPGLGRLSVRALPDNCAVYLDGAFLDHPPVFDKAVAAGSHIVSYRWPDGTRVEETVDVVEGKSAFSTGRKE
jgi:serine/threonine protein kinase